ncbi:hypothetical protein Pth03_50230 [Planotetraspora thailandica]|uniref:Uncharacterized protein n=1 Tax=Planotetraspora thailandica TaxID=487172 RepID=A0A8J3V2P6_9ACTN|nr:hypothetical protein Pth03_50230 [Planotetraspora thailandica]
MEKDTVAESPQITKENAGAHPEGHVLTVVPEPGQRSLRRQRYGGTGTEQGKHLNLGLHNNKQRRCSA